MYIIRGYSFIWKYATIYGLLRLDNINTVCAFDTTSSHVHIYLHSPCPFYYQPLSTRSMSSMDSITQALATLLITPSETVQHASAISPAAWKEALQSVPKTPKEFELLKVLVFNPKIAKSAIPVPVIVIACDGTEMGLSLLGKKLNLKELCLASGDLLSEFFSLDKDLLSPLALNMEILHSHNHCWRLPGYCENPTCHLYYERTTCIVRHLFLRSDAA